MSFEEIFMDEIEKIAIVGKMIREGVKPHGGFAGDPKTARGMIVRQLWGRRQSEGPAAARVLLARIRGSLAGTPTQFQQAQAAKEAGRGK